MNWLLVALYVLAGLLILSLMTWAIVASTSRHKTSTIASLPTTVPYNDAFGDRQQMQLQRMHVSRPSVYVIRDFLSPAEVEHLLGISRGRGERSRVKSSDGTSVVSPIRTSTSATLQAHEDEVVTAVERRAADLVGLPVSHVEDLQVVDYDPGQYYRPHQDAFAARSNTVKRHGNRRYTILAYLSTQEHPGAGGETKFTRIGLKVPPQAGTAILWDNLKKNSLDSDPMSMHTALPLKEGHKTAVNIWLRTRPQRLS